MRKGLFLSATHHILPLRAVICASLSSSAGRLSIALYNSF